MTETREEVQHTSAKAEYLLLNTLPEDVAERLEIDPGRIADHYHKVRRHRLVHVNVKYDVCC